jgi:hypothetical protein
VDLSKIAVLICHCVLTVGNGTIRIFRWRLQVILDFHLTLTQRIFAAALCAAILGGVPATFNAADPGPDYRVGAEHVRTSQPYCNWLQRCAYAGY